MTDDYRAMSRYYDLALEPWTRHLRLALRDWIVAHSVDRAVDLGCGTGRQIARIDGAVQVWGVDLSPAMLRRSRRQASGRCVRADATRTPFADASFDLAFTQFALHEKPRQVIDGLLAEARRLLRPDGHLLVTDFAHPPDGRLASRMYARVMRTIEWYAGGEHYRCFRDWMDRGGLDPVVSGAGWLLVDSTPFYRGTILMNVYRAVSP